MLLLRSCMSCIANTLGNAAHGVRLKDFVRACGSERGHAMNARWGGIDWEQHVRQDRWVHTYTIQLCIECIECRLSVSRCAISLYTRCAHVVNMSAEHPRAPHAHLRAARPTSEHSSRAQAPAVHIAIGSNVAARPRSTMFLRRPLRLGVALGVLRGFGRPALRYPTCMRAGPPGTIGITRQHRGGQRDVHGGAHDEDGHHGGGGDDEPFPFSLWTALGAAGLVGVAFGLLWLLL